MWQNSSVYYNTGCTPSYYSHTGFLRSSMTMGASGFYYGLPNFVPEYSRHEQFIMQCKRILKGLKKSEFVITLLPNLRDLVGGSIDEDDRISDSYYDKYGD